MKKEEVKGVTRDRTNFVAKMMMCFPFSPHRLCGLTVASGINSFFFLFCSKIIKPANRAVIPEIVNPKPSILVNVSVNYFI